MEDQHRWRDKFEFSLDSRQVFLLFVAVAVVIGSVFALGVVVGRRLNPAVPEQPQVDPLALLDEIDGVQSKDDEMLTFQQALAAHAGGRHDSTPAGDAAVGPSDGTPGVADENHRGNPDRTDLAQTEADKRSAPPATSSSSAARSTSTKRTVSNKTEHGFTLQLSSFQDRVEAEQFMNKLREAGMKPRMIVARIAGRGLWYRVRIGQYDSWDQAVSAKERFEHDHHMIAYVARY